MTLTTDDRISPADDGTVLGVENVESTNLLRADETLTVGELFYDDFVQAHTDTDSFEEFVARSPLSIDSVSELVAAPRADLDEYVAANSEFESWAWMVRAACEEYVQRGTTY